MANFPYYTNLKKPTPSADASEQFKYDDAAGQAAPTTPTPKQFNAAGVTGALAGGLGLYANARDMANQSLNFDTNLAPSQMSPDDMPTYTGGNLEGQLLGAKAQGATGGEVASGALQGASAGASFGAVGAGVGALVGGASALIGGRARKKKQKKEIAQAKATLQSAQNTYNTQEEGFQQKQNQMEDYYQRLNNDRMMNLYRAKRF